MPKLEGFAMKLVSNKGSGDCQYYSFQDSSSQQPYHKDLVSPKNMRKRVADYLEENEEEWIGWVEAVASDRPEINTFKKYVKGVRGCEYGDSLTLTVLAIIYNIRVIVMRIVENDTCIEPKGFQGQESDTVIMVFY